MTALRIEQLQKRYGRVHAVRGVSLSVEPGAVYGLLGPNGSGKTTTLACALGLQRPTSGSIEVLGMPANRIHATRGRVAAMFDGSTLVGGLTVRQNLQYARRLFGHRGGRGIDEAMELAGIADLGRARARSLSLGQGRRLAIARTLLGSPELLVLDEPLSGLDTKAVRSVLRLVRQLGNEGLTVIVSSHRMHEMETICDRVAILMQGELVQEGTIDDVLGSESEAGEEVFTLRAEPAQRAADECARVPGVRVLARHDRGDDHTELRVALLKGTSARLNEALVRTDVAVAALAPERATLQSVFEALLDEHAGAAPERRGA